MNESNREIFLRYKPTQDFLYLRVLQPEELRTSSGLMQVKQKSPDIYLGKVIKKGPEAQSVTVGDTVVVPSRIFSERKEPLEFIYINEHEIHGVLSE